MFFFFFVYIALMVFSFFILLKQEYPRITNAGWAIAFIFIPVLGSILFLFFSSKFYLSKKRLLNDYNKVSKHLKLNTKYLNEDGVFRLQDVLPDLENFNEDEYEIFSSDKFYESVYEGIAKAKKNIIIFTFIFVGDVSDKLMKLLSEAEERGVKVYLLIDWEGSFSWIKKHKEIIKEKKFIFMFNDPAILSKVKLINQRLHSKLVYIDNKVAWVGSHNMTDIPSEKNGKIYKSEDVSIKFTGDAIFHLVEYIERVVFYNTGEFLSDEYLLEKKFLNSGSEKTNKNSDVSKDSDSNEGKAALRYTVLWPDKKSFESTYLNSMLKAKKKCILITPYFYATTELISCIQILLLRGVKVEIICPDFLDNQFIEIENFYLAYLRSLGADIYKVVGGFQHMKIMIIDDDVVSIGSFNLDARSAFVNFEIVYEFYSKKLVSDFLKIHTSLLKRSNKYDVKSLPLKKRILANLSMVFFGVL